MDPQALAIWFGQVLALVFAWTLYPAALVGCLVMLSIFLIWVLPTPQEINKPAYIIFYHTVQRFSTFRRQFAKKEEPGDSNAAL